MPADGFGSTALVSQSKLLADAGNDVFTWNSFDLYGTNQDELVVWNSFLDGKLDCRGLHPRRSRPSPRLSTTTRPSPKSK